MASKFRNIVIVMFIVATMAFGYRFVMDSTNAMEGTSDVSEVEMLPDTASERAIAMATDCDAGDGDRCSALMTMYELQRDGVYASGKSTLRRLCRKGCNLGATDLCELWHQGDRRCPMGND
jgi:hypothetical protein